MINDYNKWTLNKSNNCNNLVLIERFDDYTKIEESIKDARQYFIKKSKQKEVDRMNNIRKRKLNVSTEYVDSELDIEEDPNDFVSDSPDSKEFTLNDLRLSVDKEQEMLRHPDLQFVLDLVSGREKNLVVNPGTQFEKTYDVSARAENYALIFLKFKIDQGADENTLKLLYSKLTNDKIKKKLNTLPLGQVSRYTKIKKEGEGTTGYELLGDHITEIESKIQGDWIRTSLIANAGIKDQQQNIIPGKIGFNQKKAFNEAPEEVQNKIISLASELINLDPSGKSKRSILVKLSGVESLEEIIEGLEIQIAAIGTPREDRIQAHLDNYPGASILYENKDIMLVTYRSPRALGELCIETQWCVKPKGYGTGGYGLFYTYNADGNVQYAVWDFSKPGNDPMSIVGFSIKPDYSIKEMADKFDKKNHSILRTATNLKDFLDFYKIPEKDKNKLLKDHKSESQTAIKTSKIYGKLADISKEDNKTKSDLALTKAIISMIEESEKEVNFTNYDGLAYENDRFMNSLIIGEVENKNIDGEKIKEEIWKYFISTKGGVTNPETVNLLNLIFKNSNYLKPSNLDEMINLNKTKISRMKMLVASMEDDENPLKVTTKQYSENKKESILRKVEILTSNLDNANLALNDLKK